MFNSSRKSQRLQRKHPRNGSKMLKQISMMLKLEPLLKKKKSNQNISNTLYDLNKKK